MHLRWTMFGMLASLVLFVSGCGGSGSGSTSGQPNATPIITALAPASITAGSQTFTLFISGTGFINGSSGVTTAFWNGSPRTAIVNTNTNQIAIAILPSDVATPGLAQITASNPGPGGGLSQTAATFLITSVQPSAPLISSLSPTTASPAGATFTLTVNGSNFMAPSNPAVPQLAGSIVQWNTSPHPTTFVNANQLTATINASDIATAGCNSVTVYTPNGVGGFIFSPSVSFAISKSGVPLICALSPASAAQNGPAFALNVIGANFTASSAVQWDGTALTTTVLGSSTLQAQVPASNLAKAGTIPITVANSGSGSATSAAVNFLVSAAAPTITSVSPSTSVAGGAAFALTVTGTNYTQDTVVEWDGSPRATKFNSPTTLTAQILAADITNAGTNSVVVVNPQGVGGASAAFPYVVTAAGAALASKFPQVVSVSAIGGPADGPSEAPAISADGRYVAFYSEAKNLVASGAAGSVFVRDTCAAVTTPCTPNTKAIDTGADGGTANGKTGRQVAISGDGRFVSFMSRATNLVSGLPQTSSGYWNVYVRDLCQGANVPSGCMPQTQLLSAAMNGEPSNGPSASPSLSDDGRFAAFVSSATNISTETGLARPQVYVRDTCAGPTATKACLTRTVAVALDDDDLKTSIQSGRPVISADGRFVAFEAWGGSTATQSPAESSVIVLADTCLGIDATVGCAPSARRISYSADGSLLAGVNLAPSISEDARFVVFESQPAAANGNPPAASKVFLRDTCLGATAPDGCSPSTALVSAGSPGGTDKNPVFSPFISESGRYISFVEGRSAYAAPKESATEGALIVRDTCFGATLPCASRAYAFSAATTSSLTNVSKTAVIVVAGSGKIPSVSVDQYSAAPISADGKYAAFYAPGTAAAHPASGVGDVYISIAMF
jgi:IPT/TIG domain-containing protein/WD40 repeat protein